MDDTHYFIADAGAYARPKHWRFAAMAAFADRHLRAVVTAGDFPSSTSVTASSHAVTAFVQYTLVQTRRIGSSKLLAVHR